MISLKAKAKVNLSLYITGIRSDGYHLLDTVMQSISLYDAVSVSLREDCLIKLYCDNQSLSGEENICYKAARLFFNESKIKGGADIHIEKRIPVAAGLGGGSADAAAVLVALNRLFKCPLDDEKMKSLALTLGADVPFCLSGGTARVKGIGEDIIPLKRKLPLYMLLIKEGEKPSTAYMYKELDKKMGNIASKASCDSICESLEHGDFEGFADSLHNDFSLLWSIDEIRDKLNSVGAEGVCLSGSGPTVIGFFREKKKCLDAFECLKESCSQIYFAEAVSQSI